MVVHLFSVAFTGFVFWVAVPGSDLFSWHPICMTVAFMLLLLQAIVVFSPESSLFPTTARPEKVQLHWILHAFGLFSAVCGFGAVYLNKEIHERRHFASWHGTFGLVTVLGSFGVALGGLCAKYSQTFKRLIKPADLKMIHATGGMIIFLLAMTTVCLAFFSNYLKNRHAISHHLIEARSNNYSQNHFRVKGWMWRVAFCVPIILAVCVARQVTQNYLPKILTPRESAIDAKNRAIQEKIDAKLAKKNSKKKNSVSKERSSASESEKKES